MYFSLLKYISLTILVSALSLTLLGQAIDSLPPTVDTSIKKELIVSYSIALQTDKKSSIGETYNGGVKTIFISDKKARIRLASLMRMQSLFYFLPSKNVNKTVAIVKESGKKRYKCLLTSKGWLLYNQKYDSAVYRFYDDSVMVLNYPCKKVIITLKERGFITAYYTEAINNSMLGLIEPVFAGVPGLVLKYEYRSNKSTLTYTAVNVSLKHINPAIFKIPSKGYQVQIFSTRAVQQKIIDKPEQIAGDNEK